MHMLDQRGGQALLRLVLMVVSLHGVERISPDHFPASAWLCLSDLVAGASGCASVTKSAAHTETCVSAVPDQATCQAMATADSGLKWDGVRDWSDRQPGDPA